MDHGLPERIGGDDRVSRSVDAMTGLGFNSAMKKLGFRRTGRTYRLGAKGESQGLVNLQGSSGSGGGNTVFYVNLNIVPKAWKEFAAWSTGKDVVEDPDYTGGVLRNRLLAPADVAFRYMTGDRSTRIFEQQWSFSGQDEAEHCGRRLTMIVERDVAPLFARLRDSPQEIIDFFSKPQAERGVLPRLGTQPSILAAVLLADHGPSAALDRAVEELRNTKAGEKILEWVHLRSTGIGSTHSS